MVFITFLLFLPIIAIASTSISSLTYPPSLCISDPPFALEAGVSVISAVYVVVLSSFLPFSLLARCRSADTKQPGFMVTLPDDVQRQWDSLTRISCRSPIPSMHRLALANRRRALRYPEKRRTARPMSHGSYPMRTPVSKTNEANATLGTAQG